MPRWSDDLRKAVLHRYLSDTLGVHWDHSTPSLGTEITGFAISLEIKTRLVIFFTKPQVQLLFVFHLCFLHAQKNHLLEKRQVSCYCLIFTPRSLVHRSVHLLASVASPCLNWVVAPGGSLCYHVLFNAFRVSRVLHRMFLACKILCLCTVGSSWSFEVLSSVYKTTDRNLYINGVREEKS